MPTLNTSQSLTASLRKVVRLQCPHCGDGPTFDSWIRMRKECRQCGLDFVREPGFYLASIYFNYGMTVALTVPVFMVLVLGYGVPRDLVLWPCAVFTIVFPLWFFRYARALWLSLAFRMSSMDFTSAARKHDTTSSNLREQPCAETNISR